MYSIDIEYITSAILNDILVQLQTAKNVLKHYLWAMHNKLYSTLGFITTIAKNVISLIKFSVSSDTKSMQIE